MAPGSASDCPFASIAPFLVVLGARTAGLREARRSAGPEDGLTPCQQRPQLPPGERKGFCSYNSWCACEARPLPHSRTQMWKKGWVTGWQHRQRRPDVLARAWASTKAPQWLQIPPSWRSFLHRYSTKGRHPSALSETETVPAAEPGGEPQLILLTAHSPGMHCPAPHRTSVRLQPLHQAEAMSAFRRPATTSLTLARRAERGYIPRFSAT